MPPPTARPRLDRWRFRWDIVLFLIFVLAAMRHGTDLPLHEVVGVVVVPVLAVHLWLNWSWIVDVLRRAALTLPREVRFNRAWDIAQCIVAVIAIGSGLLASQHLLPALGVKSPRIRLAEDIHAASAWVLMVMIGIHLGLHAHWIWSKVRRPGFLVALGVVALAAWCAPRLYQPDRALVRRFRNDTIKVTLAIIPPSLVAFGILVVARRRRAI